MESYHTEFYLKPLSFKIRDALLLSPSYVKSKSSELSRLLDALATVIDFSVNPH